MNADAPYECVTSKVLPAARIVASAALRAALATSRVLWGAGATGGQKRGRDGLSLRLRYG